MFEWYDGYKKRKGQKTKIKKELLLITWYPNRVMNWCFSEDEKKERKIVAINIDFFMSCDQIQNVFDRKRTTNKEVFCHAIFF